jgi:enoyl-CoA hydratase
MKTQFETLTLTSPAPHVTVVTMNRPAAMNAMNTKMMEELRDCFARFYIEPDAARCLILTGAGDRAFCAGADLKERDGMTDAVWRRQHAIVEQTIRAMLDCPPPIIAAVNGAAVAGGCELAMAPTTPASPRPKSPSASSPAPWARRTCRAPSASAGPRR